MRVSALVPRLRAVVGAAAAGFLMAAGLAAAPAAAQPPEPAPCTTVGFDVTSWEADTGGGGMAVTITVTDTCGDYVPPFTLDLGVPEDHTFRAGWNADWEFDGQRARANYPQQQPGPIIPYENPVTLGYVATWEREPGPPITCVLDGEPCVSPPTIDVG